MGDGLPKYLTGDELYQRVVDHEKATEEEELAKEERRKTKETRTKQRIEWKNTEKVRLERNRTRREEYRRELAVWEAERDLARRENRRTQWKRPVLTGIEPAPRKESRKSQATAGGSGDESGENASDGVSGEDDGGSAAEDR
jgi:hypothetical protein